MMNDDERKALLRQCTLAGVTKDEMHEDPEHGLCVSLSGVRKLARLAPDKAQAVRVVEEVERLAEEHRK